MKSANRIPSLDGLRAISIALVILSHLAQGEGLPFDVAGLVHFDLGQLGVRVFFVISGFLITGLLVKEYERTGTIGLREFYLRRTLRIFPAYYSFLAGIGLAALFGVVKLSSGALLQATTYTANYAVITTGQGYLPNPLGHTWSLAVEEQFYLLWPTVLLVVGLARARTIVTLLLLLSPALIFAEAHVPSMAEGVGLTFETAMAPIAAGSLLALLWNDLQASSAFRWAMGRGWWLALLLPALFAPGIQGAIGALAHAWMLPVLVQSIAITLLVAWCVLNPASIAGRILNSKAFVFVGALSYSLYLWQQPFLLGGVRRIFPLNIMLAGAFALASHYLVERPILRWRDRNARSGTPMTELTAPAP